VAGGEAFELPAGFAERLQQKIDSQLSQPVTAPSAPETMSLGVIRDRVEIGSHLVYFWQDEKEFAQGVSFLDPGLREHHHCVIFGHDEANQHVLQALRRKGFDPAQLAAADKLTVLTRQLSTDFVLAEIDKIFNNAMRNGFSAIRFLGNLAWGYPNCPEQNQVLELESRVTGLAHKFPCVVVCMYDVNTMPGRMVLKGGFETHPFTLCSHGLRENPLYVPEPAFLAELGNVNR
jgi:hypothetical protein